MPALKTFTTQRGKSTAHSCKTKAKTLFPSFVSLSQVVSVSLQALGCLCNLVKFEPLEQDQI